MFIFFLRVGNSQKLLTPTCFIYFYDFKTFKLKSKNCRCLTFGTHKCRENKTTVNIKNDTEKLIFYLQIALVWICHYALMTLIKQLPNNTI